MATKKKAKKKKLAQKKKKNWQKIGSIGNFQKNQDFWTITRYLLKISRALHIKSQKKKLANSKKKKKLAKNWLIKKLCQKKKLANPKKKKKLAKKLATKN